MPTWITIFDHSWPGSSFGEPFSVLQRFWVPVECTRLRFRCQSIAPLFSIDRKQVETLFSYYTSHSSITDPQRDTIHDKFDRALIHFSRQSPAVLLVDPKNQFRGRWDPSYTGLKEIGYKHSSDGFIDGEMIPGSWSLLLYTPQGFIQSSSLHVTIEMSADQDRGREVSPTYPIPETKVQETNLAWLIGELHEHTSRSQGSWAPEITLTTYHQLGYHFLALSDHDIPPLSSLQITSPIGLIRGQEIQWNFGHALLLGIREWFSPNPGEEPANLLELIHDVHVREGLFCVVHPFAINLQAHSPFSTEEGMAWSGVDLLEIWSGLWCDRFPEILKAFDLWDHLLNRGYRIYGTCGKGSHEPAIQEVLDRSPKTLLLSEGLSETQLLSALKQGHFYSTIEPAISMRVESEQGGVFMGDELRIPVQSRYLLVIEITQMERAFIRIKTNKGIYCEMPASSRQDTQLKFYERAKSEVQWFRIEIYRYGNPLDELLAFSNPLFVRGMFSA